MRELAVNPPSSLLGSVNAILCGRGRRYEFGGFAGPLSVKSVVRGTAVWETAAARFEVEPGSAVILNDREEYTVTIESLQPVETFCVFFARGFVEDAYRSMTSSSVELLDAPDTRAVLFAERLRYDASVLDALSALRRGGAGAQLFELASALVRAEWAVDERVAKLPAIKGSTRDELRRRVRRGVEYIHSNLGSSLRLDEIASAAALSQFHFHRLFVALYGDTPHRYITNMRIRRARSLLRATDRPVADIAMDCGFESLGSFSTLFARHTGMPPARFRKNREESAPLASYRPAHE